MTVFDPILSESFGIDSIYDEDADLADCAVEYLRGLGLTAEEIDILRQKLSQDYGGLTKGT